MVKSSGSRVVNARKRGNCGSDNAASALARNSPCVPTRYRTCGWPGRLSTAAGTKAVIAFAAAAIVQLALPSATASKAEFENAVLGEIRIVVKARDLEPIHHEEATR